MLEIRILNGLHQGASLSLDSERLVLGSSLDADIEILDPGIKERHCVIEYLKDKSSWYVQALEGDMTIGFDNKRANVIEVAEELVIKVGSIHIGFFDEAEAWNLEKYSRPEILQLGKKKERSPFSDYRIYFGITAIAGSLLTYSFADDGKTPDLSTNPVIAKHKTSKEENSNTSSITNNLNIETKDELEEPNINVETELKYMLRQRGMLKKIEVSEQEPGKWKLTGSLTADELGKISRMIARFEVTYPNIDLIDDTKAINRTLPFEIRSVASGMYAHVLTTEGDRIYIGESIHGFTLKKIENDKILFSGDHDVELLW